MWVGVVRGKAEPVVRPYFFVSPYHPPPLHRRTRVIDPQILRQWLAERLPELHAKVDGGGEDEQDAQYRLRLVRPDGDEEAPRGGVLRLVWWCVGVILCTSVYVVLSTVVYDDHMDARCWSPHARTTEVIPPTIKMIKTRGPPT